MADRVLQRHDTAARWQQYNPVLAEGEIGIITDGAKGYKIGDGKTPWNSLPFPANPANVVQETGDSESAVMSQRSVSENFVNKEDVVNDLTTGGADKALSAEMGKELGNELGAVTNNIAKLAIPTRVIEGAFINEYSGNIVTGYSSCRIKVYEGNVFYVKGVKKGNNVAVLSIWQDGVMVEVLESSRQNEELIEFHRTIECQDNQQLYVVELVSTPCSVAQQGKIINEFKKYYDNQIALTESRLTKSISDVEEELNFANKNNIGVTQVDDGKYLTIQGDVINNESFQIEWRVLRGGRIYAIHHAIQVGGTMLSCAIFSEITQDKSKLLKILETIPADGQNTYKVKYALAKVQEDCYLAVNVKKGATSILVSEYTDDVTEDIYNKISDNAEWIDNLRINSGMYPNRLCTMMSEGEKYLSSVFQRHYVNINGILNAVYDFGDVKITSDISVPQIGGSTSISISENPTYRDKLFFNVGDKVCVGNKYIYDVYTLTGVNGKDLQGKLVESNTGLSGYTMRASFPHTNENPNFGNQVSYDYVRVYKYEDILAVKYNEIPMTITTDNIHPSKAGYLLLGKIFIAEALARHSTISRVISFGDSLTAGSNGWWDGVRSVLPSCNLVPKGVPSDRIEHIMDRFKEYMENEYEAKDGDVFVFYLGTNNLLQAGRKGMNYGVDYSEKNMIFWNSSYLSVLSDACRMICTLLPRGNWFISNGHVNSLNFGDEQPS